MAKKTLKLLLPAVLLCLMLSCSAEHAGSKTASVRLITLDPGHFHASLVQKTMYDQVAPAVHVFAPAGTDVADHLDRIKAFNSRSENPTSWTEIVYTGDDFLERLLKEKPGNVVVISGNNRKKAQYIKACVDAGLNVLADKPMCIDAEGFDTLTQAFESAKKNNVLIYDIMTERSEITTILQKAFAGNPDVFGALKPGSPEEPSIVKESVHHFFKYVSGNPLKRPPWYFDTTQQGEGIVDVTTHLLDLIMWETFPNQAIDYRKDINICQARRWPTVISKEQFCKVTRLDDFPDYLKKQLDPAGSLPCYANGRIIYKIRDVFAEVSVVWNFQPPEGAGDTHFSVMKGTRSNIIIRQGPKQNYRPELYIEPADTNGNTSLKLAQAVKAAVATLQKRYPGISVKSEGQIWRLLIPDRYRLGHEAHFADVTERFLKYLKQGSLPDWEVPNIKAKYYTTTQALQLAQTSQPAPANLHLSFLILNKNRSKIVSVRKDSPEFTFIITVKEVLKCKSTEISLLSQFL